MEKIVRVSVDIPEIAKASTLEKDEDGYYTVNLGGFNIFNESGQYYRHKDPIKLISDPRNGENLFYKRLTGGYLIGEFDHPREEPNMSALDYYIRNLRLAQECAAFHIKEVNLVNLKETPKIPDSGPAVRVIGKIKPSGQYGAGLQSMLDNPSQNVAFSIRAVTKESRMGNTTIRDVVDIITWDFVNVPGIRAANKWSTIAKESYQDLCVIPLTQLLTDKEFNKHVEIAVEDSKDLIAFHRDLVKRVDKMKFSSYGEISNPFKNWK